MALPALTTQASRTIQLARAPTFSLSLSMAAQIDSRKGITPPGVLVGCQARRVRHVPPSPYPVPVPGHSYIALQRGRLGPFATGDLGGTPGRTRPPDPCPPTRRTAQGSSIGRHRGGNRLPGPLPV